MVRKWELDQTVYKNLVSILIQRLLDVYGLKFIIQWFFFVCFVSFVLCACFSSKAQGICFFLFFKAYAPNKTQERASKLISFSVSLCLDCVCLLVFFVAWLCSFASAFFDLKQIDFLFSLWWWSSRQWWVSFLDMLVFGAICGFDHALSLVLFVALVMFYF